jgi:hypothetical protein
MVHALEVREANTTATFIEEISANQPLPPVVFFSLLGAFFLYLAFLYGFGHWKRTALGEFQKRPSSGNWNL